MHGLIALFLGVIALAIILLVLGLGALQVLVVTSRAIMALIICGLSVGYVVWSTLIVSPHAAVVDNDDDDDRRRGRGASCSPPSGPSCPAKRLLLLPMLPTEL
jgi:hypothetical protein